MIFSPSTVPDIKKYYVGSWIKFPERGDCLHYVEKVETLHIDGACIPAVWASTPSEEKVCLHLHEDQPYEVEYVLPKKSLFTHKGMVCLLERIPAKQYYRGACSENVVISALRSDGWIPIDFTGKLLQSYVEKQAFTTLTSSNIAGGNHALSSRFSFSSELGILYVDTNVIGSYDGRKTLKVRPLFLPEVARLFKNSDILLESL